MSFDEPLDKRGVAEYFSSVASTYNERNYLLAGQGGKYPDIFRRHQYILEMLEGVQGKVLEVGCGSGQMLCDMLKRDFKVVGVDMAPGMIQASRSLVAKHFGGRRVDLVVGDIENLCFRDASFDLIIAAGVIEYLRSDEEALLGLYRILKPGGVLILSVRNKLNLSRLLVTTRDLLRSLPVVGPILLWMAKAVHRLLSLPPNSGIPGRRHIPWELKRRMRVLGLQPREHAFYHFAVIPRFLERRFPESCVALEEKLEILSRTPLGYFASQYIVKAQKVSHGDHRS